MKYTHHIQAVRHRLSSLSRRYIIASYAAATAVLIVSSWNWSPAGVILVALFGLLAPFFGATTGTLIKSAVGVFGLIIFFTFFNEVEVVEYLSICAFVLLVFALINLAIIQFFDKKRKIKG